MTECNVGQMFLIDKRMLAGGVAMIVTGAALIAGISSTMPVGREGMTEEETVDLLRAQQEIEDYNTLAGILIGVGFLLALISLGARRKRRSRDGIRKREKKPAE